ncbi:hypothetical protein EG329_008748 [Mollisiaceae sp. DMI_Dod_QoI]|nr:hypothetical protein EG329_008748 [Helotiales sp. DMI_Dod_QoI]
METPVPIPAFAPVESPLWGVVVGVGEELVLLSDEEVLLNDDEAFPLKVNAAEVPYVAPSPVYAMVVTTVDPTIDAQYVDEAPPFTAGVVRVLKPGSQQTAVVSAPDIPTTFLFQALGQIPGEK